MRNYFNNNDRNRKRKPNNQERSKKNNSNKPKNTNEQTKMTPEQYAERKKQALDLVVKELNQIDFAILSTDTPEIIEIKNRFVEELRVINEEAGRQIDAVVEEATQDPNEETGFEDSNLQYEEQGDTEYTEYEEDYEDEEIVEEEQIHKYMDSIDFFQEFDCKEFESKQFMDSIEDYKYFCGKLAHVLNKHKGNINMEGYLYASKTQEADNVITNITEFDSGVCIKKNSDGTIVFDELKNNVSKMKYFYSKKDNILQLYFPEYGNKNDSIIPNFSLSFSESMGNDELMEIIYTYQRVSTYLEADIKNGEFDTNKYKNESEIKGKLALRQYFMALSTGFMLSDDIDGTKRRSMEAEIKESIRATL